MDSLLVVIGTGVIFALVLNVLLPTRRPPQIVYYMPTELAPRRTLGCLPLLIVGILVLLVLEVIRF